MDKLFLLDAYALIYRAYYALIRAPRINSKGVNTSAIFGFVNTLEEVLSKERPTHIGVAFDPSGPTFRHEAYPDYKAQREQTPEVIRQSVPIIKDIIRAYRIPILEVKGYEADDVIGTLAAQARERGILTYMMTPDKDYGQLVGGTVYMYRPKTGSGGFDVMGVEEVKAKFGVADPLQVIDMLGLMGDAADNIPGCPGVGEKTAQKLIAEYGSIANLLEHTSQLKGAMKKKVEANREQITFSRFLATIKTDVPIELDLDMLRREEPDEALLRPILEELEFRTLAARIFSKSQEQAAPQQGTLVGQLFDQKAEKVEPQQEDSGRLKTLDDLDYDYRLLDTEEKMDTFIREASAMNVISFDTETTGTDPITAELVGMSFSYAENQGVYVPVPPERDEALRIVARFRPLLERDDTLKVGQNMKYDLIMLSHYGVTVRGKMFDTMIAHYVLQPELRHGMDYMAEIYLHYDTIKIEELIGPKGKAQRNMRDLDPADVYRYACEDADVTLKLKVKLEEELRQSNATRLFEEIEMPLVPVLAYMETVGVRIDPEALRETSRHFTARMHQIEEEVHALAGVDFNISSPRQVGEILFDRLKIVEKAKKTKTGQYVTSEEVLESLRGRHEIVGKILDYRGLKKLLGTYVDTLPELINPATGRIHTSFNQTVTATGRLSSSNPNLQNIPIRDDDGKEIRRAFIPDDGCLFFSADYSQIELRIMAHVSGDPHIIEAFLSGQDIHASTAARIFKLPIDKVTKDQRRKAKTANFGIIYGISAFGLAERLGIPRREAKELIDGYNANYPGISDYIERSKERARKDGYIETLFHRRRYLPDINSGNAVVRGYAERNAVNAPIQGTAADIIKVAMIRIYRRFQEEGIRSKMILQVHDELNFSVYPEERERVQEIVITEMEGACSLKVPLQADCGWGSNWLEAH